MKHFVLKNPVNNNKIIKYTQINCISNIDIYLEKNIVISEKKNCTVHKLYNKLKCLQLDIACDVLIV